MPVTRKSLVFFCLTTIIAAYTLAHAAFSSNYRREIEEKVK